MLETSGLASAVQATPNEQVAVSEGKEVSPLESPTSKFALLSQKEKAYTRKMLDLKAREDALNAREEEYKNSYIPKKRFSEDPLAVMQEAGVDYNRMTELMLNQPSAGDPEIAKLQQRIAELEEGHKKTQTKFEETQSAAYQQALTQIKNEVKHVVGADSQFETIKETGSEDAVAELIEQHFHEKGFLLSVEDACQQVEDYLVEEAMKMANLNKVKARLTPKVEEKLEQAVSNRQLQNSVTVQKVEPTKTLTNAITQSSRAPSSAKERRERAILAFQGEL